MQKEPTLTESEVIRLFEARNIDLKLAFFEDMFMRFKEHCSRKCINRKLRLEDVIMNMLIFYSSGWALRVPKRSLRY